MSNFSLKQIKAIILAGGKGTRLSKINNYKPKVLLKMVNKTLLSYVIKNLRNHGITNFIYKLGYQSDMIKKVVQNQSLENEKCIFLVEKELLGTCGGLNYLQHGDQPILVIYGDVVSNINIRKLLKFHINNSSQATLVVHESDHPEDSDVVVLDNEKRVISIVNKPESGNFGNITNAAMYLLDPICFSKIPEDKKFDFGKDLFPLLLDSNIRMFGYETKEYIRDAGTAKRFSEVSNDIKKDRVFNKVEAVFLDRDGTIIEEKNLLSNINDISIIDGVPEAIIRLNNAGIPVIMATNQPVVARNLCTEKEVMEINAKIRELLNSSNGSFIDEIFFCPHHPDRGYSEENKQYKIECDCRKPKPGMLIQASNRRGLNLRKSFMIGDTTTDIETGKRAQSQTVLVKTGYAGRDSKFKVEPDYTFDSLLEATKFILNFNSEKTE